MDHEPLLTTASLINHVVRDMLYQQKFGYAHFPEMVDLAVVGSGLGMLQSNISFVNTTGSYWDSTAWGLFPWPFLDSQSLAYVMAVAAWIRGDQNPDWASELRVDVKRPMLKSLKYLFKTHDSFFQESESKPSTLDHSQNEWLTLATSKSSSQQVIAINQLEPDEQLKPQQEALLLEKLRTGNRAVLLHSIEATHRLKLDSAGIASELRVLTENRDDEVRAKSMCALAKLGQLDEISIDVAAKMLDCSVKFVVYSGLFALSSIESVPQHVLPPANRGLVRALQSCDYEFVGLFITAFNRWLEDPKTHFENLLEDDSPEYLQIALESLQNVREQLVALG